MKYVRQFGIIIVISLMGEILHAVIPAGIPASIYGIIILFAALELKIIKLESVKQTGDFLIETMPLMFIPAAVGLMKTWDIIKESWAAYIIITFATTFIVMIVSGLVTKGVLSYQRRKSNRKEGRQ